MFKIFQKQKGLPASATPKPLQAGVSLIVVFFIMTIILAIVLSITIMLYDKIRIIRNIGNSVVAYYAANSGIEKVIYFERKGIPQKLSGGLCNICNTSICPNDSRNCGNCELTELSNGGCAHAKGCVKNCCDNCEISFDTVIGAGKSYKIKTTTGKDNFVVDSFGTYKNTVRAIELKAETGGANLSGPEIKNAFAQPNSIAHGQDMEVDISANIIDRSGTGLSLTQAIIKDSTGKEIITIQLTLAHGSFYTYTGQWTDTEAQPGAYYVDITACDNGLPEKKCATLNDI